MSKETYKIIDAIYDEDYAKTGHAPTVCSRCGAIVERGIRGCWELFNEVLNRQYQDADWMQVNQLFVDAYALQHYDFSGPTNVPAHLVHLYYLLEMADDPFQTKPAKWFNQYVADLKTVPQWKPPTQHYPLTVMDIARAETANDHQNAVMDFAVSVLRMWSLHHDWAQAELRKIFPDR